jgi:hypothetical protein
MLVYFMVNWNILRLFGMYILRPFGNVVVICYNIPCFGILCHEKSGNPATLWSFFLQTHPCRRLSSRLELFQNDFQDVQKVFLQRFPAVDVDDLKYQITVAFQFCTLTCSTR